jgi:ribosomal protein L31
LELHLVGIPESQDLALDPLLQLVSASHPAYAARAKAIAAQRRTAHFGEGV